MQPLTFYRVIEVYRSREDVNEFVVESKKATKTSKGWFWIDDNGVKSRYNSFQTESIHVIHFLHEEEAIQHKAELIYEKTKKLEAEKKEFENRNQTAIDLLKTILIATTYNNMTIAIECDLHTITDINQVDGKHIRIEKFIDNDTTYVWNGIICVSKSCDLLYTIYISHVASYTLNSATRFAISGCNNARNFTVTFSRNGFFKDNLKDNFNRFFY